MAGRSGPFDGERDAGGGVGCRVWPTPALRPAHGVAFRELAPQRRGRGRRLFARGTFVRLLRDESSWDAARSPVPREGALNTLINYPGQSDQRAGESRFATDFSKRIQWRPAYVRRHQPPGWSVDACRNRIDFRHGRTFRRFVQSVQCYRICYGWRTDHESIVRLGDYGSECCAPADYARKPEQRLGGRGLAATDSHGSERRHDRFYRHRSTTRLSD